MPYTNIVEDHDCAFEALTSGLCIATQLPGDPAPVFELNKEKRPAFGVGARLDRPERGRAAPISRHNGGCAMTGRLYDREASDHVTVPQRRQNERRPVPQATLTQGCPGPRHVLSESALRISDCVTEFLRKRPFCGSLVLRLPLRADHTRRTLASDGAEIRYAPDWVAETDAHLIETAMARVVMACP